MELHGVIDNGSYTGDCHEGPTRLKTLEIIISIRSSIAGISFIMSVIALLLLIIHFWHGQCSRPFRCLLSSGATERMFIYLLITSILYSLACLFQWLVLLDYTSNRTRKDAVSCQVTSFFTLWFNWTLMLMAFCIILYLLTLLYPFSCMKGVVAKKERWLKRFEVFYLILSFFGPLLFVFWPFLHGYYGLDGTWCFIHSMSSNCTTDIIGVIEQLFIWYVWKILLTLFALVMLVVIICRIVRMKKRSPTLIALLCYIILHVISTGIAILVRALASWITNDYILPLGIVYSVVDPCQSLAAALIVFVHLCRTCCQSQTQNEETTHLMTPSEKTIE